MKKFFYLLMVLTTFVGFASCGSDDEDSVNLPSGAKRLIGYWIPADASYNYFDPLFIDETGICFRDHAGSKSFKYWVYNEETSTLSVENNIWNIVTINEKVWTSINENGYSKSYKRMSVNGFFTWLKKCYLVNEKQEYFTECYREYTIVENKNITFDPQDVITYDLEVYVNSKREKFENAGTIKIENPYNFQKMKILFTGKIEGTFHIESKSLQAVTQ